MILDTVDEKKKGVHTPLFNITDYFYRYRR